MADSGTILSQVSLDDKYTIARGRAFMTGTQALVRLALLQQERDRRDGLEATAGQAGEPHHHEQAHEEQQGRPLDPLEQFRRMVEVNLLGTFQVIQVIGARMVAERRGSIINIGSLYASVSPDQRFYDHLAGDLPFLKSPAYGASKAGVVNMTKYFSTLWGKAGVRVNTLSPGGVLGGQDADFKAKFGSRVPLGRMATPDEIAGVVAFLASADAAYITGAVIPVDGGLGMGH